MSAETVAQKTKELVGFVRKVQSEEALLGLRYWEEAYGLDLAGYFRESAELFGGEFGPPVGEALEFMGRTWFEERAVVRTALRVRSRELAVDAGNFSRPPVQPADAVQNGDLRSVQARVQVYIDGHWHILGDRCAS